MTGATSRLRIPSQLQAHSTVDVVSSDSITLIYCQPKAECDRHRTCPSSLSTILCDIVEDSLQHSTCIGVMFHATNAVESGYHVILERGHVRTATKLARNVSRSNTHSSTNPSITIVSTIAQRRVLGAATTRSPSHKRPDHETALLSWRR
jgi:hypothetical protein